MRRSAEGVRLFMAAAGLAVACDKSDSVVIVKVDADPGVADVVQLRAYISNGGVHVTRFFPDTFAPGPIAMPTSFSLTVPRDRTGAFDVALDGVSAGGGTVASGAGSVDLRGGETVTLPITLHAGPGSCGNGVIDSGETCDDGDRFTTISCNYICQLGTGGPGTGGTGAGGAGGTASGSGGSGGTAGAAGVAGIGGGTGGTGGSTAGRGGNGGTGATAGTGGQSCTVELLTSGDFDGSNTVWMQVTALRPLIYNYNSQVLPSIVPVPQSAPRLAWLGYDAVSSEPALRQTFAVPTNAVTLTISGYYQIQTDESPCQCDFVYVELERTNADGGVSTSQLKMWGNENASADWAMFTTFVTSTAMAGQNVTLQLRAKMDDGVNTSFFFDSLSVVANVCP